MAIAATFDAGAGMVSHVDPVADRTIDIPEGVVTSAPSQAPVGLVAVTGATDVRPPLTSVAVVAAAGGATRSVETTVRPVEAKAEETAVATQRRTRAPTPF